MKTPCTECIIGSYCNKAELTELYMDRHGEFPKWFDEEMKCEYYSKLMKKILFEVRNFK
jgi:hypothetical protein